MTRTLKEKAIDYFLTLYLVDDAFSRLKIGFLPDTKLQKLVFLSEKSMIHEREKGFNFNFIKLTHGPFSQELKTSYDNLSQIGILGEFGLTPTTNSKIILEDFQEIIKRNTTFFQKITTVNNDFAKMH